MAGEPLGYKVTGLKELRVAIRAAQDQDLPKELKEAYRNTALAVSGRAYQLAPKYTGDLADSIKPVATLTSASVTAGNGKVEYAGPIHWGWPKHHIQAQPFIADALNQQFPAITQYFDDAVDRVGKKISTTG
jgi:hypothetical protein